MLKRPHVTKQTITITISLAIITKKQTKVVITVAKHWVNLKSPSHLITDALKIWLEEHKPFPGLETKNQPSQSLKLQSSPLRVNPIKWH